MPEHPRGCPPLQRGAAGGVGAVPGGLCRMRGSVSDWPAGDLLSPGTVAKESFSFSWVPHLQGGSPSRSCACTGELVGTAPVPAGIRLPRPVPGSWFTLVKELCVVQAKLLTEVVLSCCTNRAQVIKSSRVSFQGLTKCPVEGSD